MGSHKFILCTLPILFNNVKAQSERPAGLAKLSSILEAGVLTFVSLTQKDELLGLHPALV